MAGELRSGLARKLFADATDIEARLALKDNPPPSFFDYCRLAALPAWAELEQLLKRIIERRIPTLVYGDYDDDGITASCLLFRFLRQHGVPGNCFLPSRFRHGYGLHAAIVEQAAGQGYGALLVLDCGTANLAEVELARRLGLEVAIIDHHQAQDELPLAPLLNPVLDPTLPPLCTAGLVYAVLEQLAARLGGLAGDELELAGLATIGDVVPFGPANWYLASEALRLLPTTANHGLLALIKVAGLHGLTRLTCQQAAFNLVPRLNAPGRMNSARKGLDLLTAPDAAQATALAAEIDRLNWERRDIADLVTRQALLDATQFAAEPGIVLYRAEWHPGVLGLVAARVAEQFGKPAAILAAAPALAGTLAGSVRSYGGVDVQAALALCPALASCGGHAQAAGLKLPAEQLDAFRGEWSAAVGQAGSVVPAASAEPLEVGLGEFTAEFETDLWRLAPFGADFAAPRAVLTPCRITRLNLMGRDRLHISLSVSDGQRELRLVGFRQSHLASRFREGALVRATVELDVDNYNNQCTIQVRLLDLTECDATRHDHSG